MHLKPDMPVSKLTKILRNEKDYEREHRGGTRGGANLFKWEDLKKMKYKERECYLGYTSKLGYLDKGGQWKKNDFYKSTTDPIFKDKSLEEAKKADKERLIKILKKKDPTHHKPSPERFTKKIKK